MPESRSRPASRLEPESRPTPESVRQLFDRIAPVYDAFNDRLSFGLHRVWKRMAVKWSGAKPGDRAVDLCCGSGDLALLLARAVAVPPGSGAIAGSVVGVDFSANLLAAARDRARRTYPPPAIDWVAADVLALPFPDGQFQAATMGYGLRNLADCDRALEEIHRVLAPGARVAILDMHRPADPTLRQFQQWYLDRWVVPTAKDCGLEADYAYIGPSLDRFPIGPEQVERARAAGFAAATHYPIAGGMMGILVAQTPQ